MVLFSLCLSPLACVMVSTRTTGLLSEADLNSIGTKHWEVLRPCIAHISSLLSGLAHVCPGLFWGSDSFSILCTFR